MFVVAVLAICETIYDVCIYCVGTCLAYVFVCLITVLVYVSIPIVGVMSFCDLLLFLTTVPDDASFLEVSP